MESENKNQFWQLWMILSLLSAILFPFTGIVASVKMYRARLGDYTTAKRWTILSFVLFGISYVVLLAALSVRFVHILS